MVKVSFYYICKLGKGGGGIKSQVSIARILEFLGSPPGLTFFLNSIDHEAYCQHHLICVTPSLVLRLVQHLIKTHHFFFN